MEIAKKTDQKRFFEALLAFDWLPVQVRRAVMSELGLSLREQKKKNNDAIGNDPPSRDRRAQGDNAEAREETARRNSCSRH